MQICVQAMDYVGKIIFVVALTAGIRLIVQTVNISHFPSYCVRNYIYFIFHLFLLGQCPSGIAWVDKPYTLNVAHQTVECSNAGVCNKLTGTCACYEGFSGNACQRSNLFLIICSIKF